MQKCDNLVDLGKCCKMSIYLQNVLPMQPRTRLLKFGHLAAQSGKSTVVHLPTKADGRSSDGRSALPAPGSSAAAEPAADALDVGASVSSLRKQFFSRT